MKNNNKHVAQTQNIQKVLTHFKRLARVKPIHILRTLFMCYNICLLHNLLCIRVLYNTINSVSNYFN